MIISHYRDYRDYRDRDYYYRDLCDYVIIVIIVIMKMIMSNYREQMIIRPNLDIMINIIRKYLPVNLI